MNISNQLKNYRKEFNISQEELAEIVHVSRQTISNWENNKSYPDLQSLLLISKYFKISLDELVKGDVVKMKNQLEKNEMDKYAIGMGVGAIFMLLSIPIVKRIGAYGFVAIIIFASVMLWSTFKVEKIKKDKNLQTYKEVSDYIESGKLPDKDKKNKRLMIQNITYILGSGFITAVLSFLLLKCF